MGSLRGLSGIASRSGSSLLPSGLYTFRGVTPGGPAAAPQALTIIPASIHPRICSYTTYSINVYVLFCAVFITCVSLNAVFYVLCFMYEQ